MALSDLAAKALYPLWGKRLTVLLYHRLLASNRCEQGRYPAVVSATQAQFENQMAFVARHFHPIDVARLLDWLSGRTGLPPRPLLITFDDGYRENLDLAWPVLQRFGLPAVLFLATDYIGSDLAFEWERAAHCFAHSTKYAADLPLLGQQSWTTAAKKLTVMQRWYRFIQVQPEPARLEAMRRLPTALGVMLDQHKFRHICLDWGQVRQLCESGLDLGSHTQSHSLLDRLDPDRVRTELNGSRAKIQEATGQPVRVFSYPNGVQTVATQDLVREAGYEAAFATSSGTSRLVILPEHPLCIRRISVSRADTASRFVAKLVGLHRADRSSRPV